MIALPPSRVSSGFIQVQGFLDVCVCVCGGRRGGGVSSVCQRVLPNLLPPWLSKPSHMQYEMCRLAMFVAGPLGLILMGDGCPCYCLIVVCLGLQILKAVHRTVRRRGPRSQERFGRAKNSSMCRPPKVGSSHNCLSSGSLCCFNEWHSRG